MTNPDLTIEQYNQMTPEQKRDIHNTICVYGFLYMLDNQFNVPQERGMEIVEKVATGLGFPVDAAVTQMFGPPVNLTEELIVEIAPTVIIELISAMSRTNQE